MATTDYSKFYLGVAGSEVPMSANDATVNHTTENIRKEVRTAAGVLKVYLVAQMEHWQWSYKFLYGRTRDVYDGGMGYDDLKTLLIADQEMSYLVPSDTSNGQIAYTVRFVAGSWRSRIVFRGNADLWAWEVNFEVVQTK